MGKLILIYLLVSFLIGNLSAYTITVDGARTDWDNNDGSYGSSSLSTHGSGTYNGQFIYEGKSGDARDSNNSDYDLVELRVGHDGTYLYIMAEMDDVTNVNNPILAISFDASESGGSNWIGDDSNTYIESSPSIDRTIIIHCGTAGTPTIEMYDESGSGNWYAPSAGYSASISTTYDVIEARIKLSDIDVSSNENFNFWACTFKNESTGSGNYWANNGDCTNDWGTGSDTDAVDGMTPGASDENWWNRAEFDDGNNDIENGYKAGITYTDVSLPVELTSFTATSLKSVVQLNWITESEIDNLGFLVDRSLDPISGFTTIADYRYVPELQGQGSVTYRTDYSYTDTEVVPGTKYYYVLSDVTGNPEHGEPVTRHTDKMVNATPLWADSETGILKDFRLLKVYPNPFNPVASISYASDVSGNVQMDIVDMNGNVVKSLINEYHSAGSYELNWAPDELSAGVYFCRMISEENRVTRKFIYLK